MLYICNMKTFNLALAFALIFSSPFGLMAHSKPERSGKLFEESVVTIKDKAIKAGKPYLVQFTASWCMPCKWMEGTSYQDQKVKSYLLDHYLTAKVNIDDFDGFAWKEYYGVKNLPTLLIFSADGKLLEKRENALSTSQLLALLKSHNELPNQNTGTSPAESEGIDNPFPQVENTIYGDHVIRDAGDYNMTDQQKAFLQFGAFGSVKNAQAGFERLSKTVTLPLEIFIKPGANGEDLYILRSVPIDPNEKQYSNWKQECFNFNIQFLEKTTE